MIVTYVVFSSCDDNGDLLLGGGRILARGMERTVAENFMRETLEQYKRQGIPIGWGCLWMKKDRTQNGAELVTLPAYTDYETIR